jgi:hypothetical protein
VGKPFNLLWWFFADVPVVCAFVGMVFKAAVARENDEFQANKDGG